jgi:MFS family permease
MNVSVVEYVRSHIPPPGPQRTYLVSYAIGMVGSGAFLPIYVLYLTQIVGIPNSQTALAISIAALVGLPLTLVAGDLADRLGPRRVVLFGLAGQVVGMASYVFIQGFWSLLIIVTSMNIFAYAYLAAEGALMRRIAGAGTVTFRSQVLVMGSIAVTVGAVIAGIGISIGTPTVYRAMFLAVAAGYVVVLGITRRIPNYAPLPKPETPQPAGTGATAPAKRQRWIVLRDKPFIVYAAVTGVMTVSSFAEHQLLPIWIVAHTNAPGWTVALVFVVNTAISVTLQMRLSRDVRTLKQAGQAMLRYGLTLPLAYLMLAMMAGRSAWMATLLVVIGITLISIAQIWGVSGRFVFEFNLPPAHSQGQYDGFLNIFMTLGVSAAPLVLIGVVADRGFAGWVGLGVLFLVLGLVSPAIAAWGERTRPQATEPAETEPVATRNG